MEENMTKKWVVLVDVQKDFIDGALRNEEAIKKVPNIIEKIKNLDKTVEIIATQDTHENDYLSTYEGKNLPVTHCIADTEGWNLNKEVEQTLKESGLKYMKVRKPTFGCYALGYIIESGSEYGEPESIEVCGFCTDICVVSNVLMLRAHFPNVPIVVDAACCAGITPEKHKAALEVMKSCQITIVNEEA